MFSSVAVWTNKLATIFNSASFITNKTTSQVLKAEVFPQDTEQNHHLPFTFQVFILSYTYGLDV